MSNLVKIAREDQDYASLNFLQWFVDEQVEEVDTMSKLLATIKHAGGMLLVEDFVRRNLANPHGAGGEEEGEE